jgi:hypothetical protein
VPVEDVGDHRPHRRRPDRRGVDLAPADDAIVGGQLDEDELAPAEPRRGIADDEHLEVAEPHGRHDSRQRARRKRRNDLGSAAW